MVNLGNNKVLYGKVRKVGAIGTGHCWKKLGNVIKNGSLHYSSRLQKAGTSQMIFMNEQRCAQSHFRSLNSHSRAIVEIF